MILALAVVQTYRQNFSPVPLCSLCIPTLFFNSDFTYLFLERGEGREEERERNINVWLPLTHPLPGGVGGPGPQSRYMP